MTELKSFLKHLLSLPGLSAYETPVREAIAETWKPLVDELSVSRLGSLHGLKKGAGPEPRPRILLAAHMDAIGLMVTSVTEGGLLRIFRIGGVDPRILPGMPVKVFATGGSGSATATQPLPAVIVMPPDSLLPEEAQGKPVKMKHLLVDTGLEPDEVRAKVRVGDIVAFDTQPAELSGDAITGHSLDNRASVVAITATLDALQHTAHAWDVYAVATISEEETLGGGFTSPFEIRPQVAVAVDVTHASGPGASDWRTKPLGKGPTLDWGPNTHPALFDAFKDVAEQAEIPYNISVYPSGSGTDAMGMQIVAEGIPTMVVSIPLRYMHTPVEEVSMKDITRAGRLLAEFIAGLQPEFVEQIKYPEE